MFHITTSYISFTIWKTLVVPADIELEYLLGVCVCVCCKWLSCALFQGSFYRDFSLSWWTNIPRTNLATCVHSSVAVEGMLGTFLLAFAITKSSPSSFGDTAVYIKVSGHSSGHSLFSFQLASAALAAGTICGQLGRAKRAKQESTNVNSPLAQSCPIFSNIVQKSSKTKVWNTLGSTTHANDQAWGTSLAPALLHAKWNAASAARFTVTSSCWRSCWLRCVTNVVLTKEHENKNYRAMLHWYTKLVHCTLLDSAKLTTCHWTSSLPAKADRF